MSVKGDFDDLDKLIENASKLDGEHEVSMEELFGEGFMSSCSKFSSFEEFLDASGYEVQSNEDFEKIPDDEWDDFVSSNTSYQSWKEMQEAAVAKYAEKQLFKGL